MKKTVTCQIVEVLKKYFELEDNEEYDPTFSAQDAIDEICDIVSFWERV